MASANPDESLTADDGIVPTSLKGLDYPFGARVPGPGEALTIAPGVRWARIPLPGSLGHINVWLLDDADAAGPGIAIVDTGLDLPQSRDAWGALFAGPLAGSRITRVIVTHFHPDHIGMAGRLCARDGAPLVMTRTEWLLARMLQLDVRDAPPPEQFAWWRMAGYTEDQVAVAAARGWGQFARATSPVPPSHVRIADGDRIVIGARTWRIVVGSGHTPEHACLVDDTGGLMIAGDQVLPRITSNVSVSLSEPEGDPLGDWLASIERLRGLDPGLLVLPAHGEPFAGLHTRLDGLRDGHRERLAALRDALAAPRRAADCFDILFHRPIDDGNRGLAAGETLAHLHRLMAEGAVRREMTEGVARFVAC